MVGWLAIDSGATTLNEVATRFHRDPTTMSRIVGRIDRDARTSPPLAEALKRLKNTLAHA
jgi:hypothetical protein